MALSHFDWYEATIPAVWPDRSAAFGCRLLEDYIEAEGLDGTNFHFEREKGFNHYRDCLAFYDQDRIAQFRLLMSPDQPVHFISSGKRAATLSGLVRKYEPQHLVTRADSALDWVGDPSAFESVAGKMRECRDNANRRGRKLGITTIHQEQGGDTIYLGSMRSEAFLRIYDKTAEQRSLLPRHLAADLPEFWTRAEIVARPKKPAERGFLAKADPDDVWNFNPACAEFMRYLNEAETAALPEKSPRVEDFNRAYWALLYQYRKTFIELAKNRCRGSWSALGEQIKADLEKADLL